MNSLLDFYRFVKDKDINIIYSGPIWSNGVEGIGDTLKRRLEFDDLPLPTSQAVFSVFVEQMNNMLMYSAEKFVAPAVMDEKQAATATGIFLLSCRGKQYFVQSGNVLRNDQVNIMKDKIDYLNTLDKQELRKFYKQKLREENDNPESRGGGIGLVEIAKRASSKIDYSFERYDDAHSFFTMSVTIE